MFNFKADMFMSKDILQLWKTIRNSLTSDLTDIEQLEIVTKFWSFAPLQSRILDWDKPTEWPSPWELIGDKNYDESSIAVAMMYTLLFGNDGRWNSSNLRLILATDRVNSIQNVMLVVKDTWLLNYEYAKISDWAGIKNNLHIHHRYNYNNDNKFK